jgi:multiple sugar transport system substrate-binding protein
MGIAAVAAFALVAAGCSGGGSGSKSSSGKTLTYWASNQASSVAQDKKVLKPELKKFQKKTGIHVKFEVIGWNNLQDRIQTATSSGKAPDVVNIGNTWAPSLQATKAFMPFKHKQMQAIGGSDKFVKTALKTGGAPGKPVTSVPYLGLAYGLYYNKKMLKDAGIKPPQTWNQMVAAAKKLTKPKKNRYGFAVAGGSYTENVHFAFINAAQNGGSWFDKTGKPTFTKSANIDGIKRYLDLMQKDKVAPVRDAEYSEATKSENDFAKGKAAMILNQNNAGNSLTSQGMDKDAYGVVPFPAPEHSKKIASFPAGINMSIFKNTHNKKGALKFVKFMTSAKEQKILDKPFSALPVLKGKTPTFTSRTDVAKTFQDVYNNKSKPLPLVPAEDQFESTVGKSINKMFAHIASGKTVSKKQIRTALGSAEKQVKSSG